MTYFILFVVMTEGMLVEKVLFLLVGLLAIVPFWLRDYRKNRRTLIVTSDGIKQTNKKRKGSGLAIAHSKR